MSIIMYVHDRIEKQFIPTLLTCFLLFSLVLALAACGEYVLFQYPEHVEESDIASEPYYELNTDETPDCTLVVYSNELDPALLPIPMSHRIIATGVFHSLVITDGRLWAWGSNRFGQLGDGTMENRTTPVQIGTDTDWISIDVGMGHTVALKTNGSLWAWGNNEFGNLGDGTTENRTSPVQIGSDTNWVTVVAGDDHTMAIKTDGTLWAWGANSHGQIGDGTVTDFGENLNVLEPIQIGTDTDWVRVMPCGLRTLALKADGSLWFWGSDLGFSLGNGLSRLSPPFPPSQIHSTPIQIGIYADWIRMTTPTSYDGGTWFEIREDGSLWAYGNKWAGMLGDGTTIDRDIPVQIGIDTDWVYIALGDSRAVAIKADGSVWSWGWWGWASHDCHCFYLRMTGEIAAGNTSWDCSDCTALSLIGDGTYGENRHSPVMILEGRGCQTDD